MCQSGGPICKKAPAPPGTREINCVLVGYQTMHGRSIPGRRVRATVIPLSTFCRPWVVVERKERMTRTGVGWDGELSPPWPSH